MSKLNISITMESWAVSAARKIVFPDGEPQEGYTEADINEVATLILTEYLNRANQDDVASLLRDACYLLRSAWAFVPPGHELGERIHAFLNGEEGKRYER